METENEATVTVITKDRRWQQKFKLQSYAFLVITHSLNLS